MRGPLENAWRLQALRAATGQIGARAGTVTNYDPANFMVRVTVHPEEKLSGWLPVASTWVGNGWGMFAAPSIGDVMTIEYLDGDLDGGFALARLFNDNAPPLNVPSGEFWLVHAKGQFLKLTGDGALTVSDAHGASIELDGAGNVNSAGTWSHTGKLTVSSDITSSGGNIKASAGNVSDQVGSMASIRSTYDSHTHVAPSGGGTTSAPTPTM